MATKEIHQDPNHFHLDRETVLRLTAVGLSAVTAVLGVEAMSRLMFPDVQTPTNTYPEVPPIVRDCDAVLDLSSSNYFDTHGKILPFDQIPVGSNIANINKPVGEVVFRSGKIIKDAACVTKIE